MSSIPSSMKGIEEEEEEEDTRFKCEKCNRCFRSQQTFAAHMKFHGIKYKNRQKNPVAFFSSSSNPSVHSDRVENHAMEARDAAFDLMMLSCDSWDRPHGEDIIGFSRKDQQPMASAAVVKKAKTQHVCETCGLLFDSYQALGGHRASHVKAAGRNLRPVENDTNGNGSDDE